MNESQWTGKLLKELRQQMPQATIWKWSDRISAGRADFSITAADRTGWFEVKVEPGARFDKLQMFELQRVRGWYCIWYADERRAVLIEARRYNVLQFAPRMSFDELVSAFKRMFTI